MISRENAGIIRLHVDNKSRSTNEMAGNLRGIIKLYQR